MNILCLGVNHESAPVEIRERLAFAQKHLAESLHEIQALETIDEVVVLSTCNRVEIYAVSEKLEHGFDKLTEYLSNHFEMRVGELVDFYKLHNEAAARHLFAVAGGLDSMVLGETEIFGQVKQAYADSQSAGATSRILNKLFQQTFRAGKLIRSSTQLTRGATSVGSVAVDLAEKIFGDLSSCRVMLIGAGDMSRRTAKSLRSRGAKSIIVSNRSYDNAVELANEMDGKAIRFDDWANSLDEVDIVVSSTSAPHHVIHSEMINQSMRHRRQPLFVIDIAVPRDVEPEVGEIENVYLYDIDALEGIAAATRNDRKKQITVCEQVLEQFIQERGIEALAPRPSDRLPQNTDSQKDSKVDSNSSEALPES
ncbi:MAG: glutamyl-tRNA reductase [Verrucomicrobia bacterium]|nr:glutamyl-tRNA reductase [Verrucomicrobiota bacterium]